MSNRGFQAALAHLLISADVRAEFLDSPDLIAARFELTPREVAQLDAIDGGRLEFSAQGIVRLRTRALKRIFATTFRLSGDPQLLDALSDFVATEVPHADADEARRWLVESRRFVDYLARAGAAVISPQVAELARLEWLRFDLLYSPEADQAARSAEACELAQATLSDEEVRDRLLLALGPHVRLAEFSFDVLAVKPGHGPGAASSAPVATHVALTKRPASPAVGVYRISEQVFTVLRACDGTRTLREIFMARCVAAEVSGDPLSSAAEFGRFGMARRLLVDASQRLEPATRPGVAKGHGQSVWLPAVPDGAGRR